MFWSGDLLFALRVSIIILPVNKEFKHTEGSLLNLGYGRFTVFKWNARSLLALRESWFVIS